MEKVIAVVVTYNRKELLQECIDAILNQTYRVTNIIIIDNASTDGTYELLDENGFTQDEHTVYRKLDKNIGGAGGFHEGMKDAFRIGTDYVWVMDDDTIPTKTALEELINATDKTPANTSFWASTVYGAKGEFMNLPTLDTRLSDNNYACWYDLLYEGMVRVRTATFVSLLFPIEMINKCGLPVSFYFIWGDDTEYTLRATKYYGPAYFVGKSKVIHKRSLARALSFEEETNKNRIRLHYYFIRNQLLNSATYDDPILLKKLINGYYKKAIKLYFGIGVKRNIEKAKIVYSGVRDFVKKNYDVKSFEERFTIEEGND